MTKEEILDAIAPCSLCCYTCPAKKNGVIENTAKQLLNYHKGYYNFLCRVVKSKRKIKVDKIFVEELEKKTIGHCKGCRSGKHSRFCIDGCFIFDCTTTHGVDFCGECHEFPCEKAKALFHTSKSYSDNVLSDYIQGNMRIKEVGVEKYYKEITARSHYLSWKNKKS